MNAAAQARVNLVLQVSLPFLAGTFLSYMYRSVNAVLGPQLANEFGLGPAELGLLTAAYFITFGLLQIPLGVVLDRLGPRRVDACLMLFAAGGALVYAGAQGFGGLFVGRALIGIGSSAALMSTFQAFVLWYPPQRTAVMIAIAYAAGSFGAMSVSIPLQLALEVWNWRSIFVGFALVTLAVSVLLWFAAPEAPPRNLGKSFAQQLVELGRVLGDPAFRRLAIAIGSSQCAAAATFSLWMGTWLRDVAGFTPMGMAQTLATAGMGMVFGYLFFGRLADARARAGRSVLPVFMLGVASGSACLLVLLLGLTRGVPAASVAVWTLFCFSSTGATLAHAIASRRYPQELAGRINTFLNTCTFVGAFFGQWAVGLIIARWPVTVVDGVSGYSPEAYVWGLGLLWAVQAGGLAWLWSGRRLLERPAPQVLR
jgi:predicted MFS family arabinose efflux permease